MGQSLGELVYHHAFGRGGQDNLDGQIKKPWQHPSQVGVVMLGVICLIEEK